MQSKLHKIINRIILCLYDAQLIQLMSKKCAKLILQHVLHNSQHQVLARMTSICRPSPSIPLKVDDNLYLDTKLSNIQCEYLLEPSYSHLRSPSPNAAKSVLMYPMPYNFAPKKIAQEQIDLENRLIADIKKLNQFKSVLEVYQDIEELVQEIGGKEINECKKYFIYVYKWIANKSGRLGGELEAKGSAVRTAIREKVLEAAPGVNQQRKARQEFERIEILAKARELESQGNHQQAKTNYQSIFQNPSYDVNARMQALEYLCKSSRRQGDETYLHNMITKMKEQKLQHRFMRYVENTLRELNRGREATPRKE